MPSASPRPFSADLLTRLAGLLLAPLPKAPLGWAAQGLCALAVARRPGLPERMSAFVGRRVRLAPHDLPVAFELTLTDAAPRVVAVEATAAGAPADASVAGSLADLLSLLQGHADGDALFFSGRLRFAGDTELVLALRNAVDDARLDIPGLLVEAAGPAGPLVRRMLVSLDTLHRHGAAGLDAVRDALTAPLATRLAQQAATVAELRSELDLVRQGRRRRPAAAEPLP